MKFYQTSSFIPYIKTISVRKWTVLKQEFLFLLLLFTGTGFSSAGPSVTGKFPLLRHYSSDTAYVRVSPRDPRYFELSDGTPFIPVGLNLANPRTSDETEGMTRMKDWMIKLAKYNGNFVRFWYSAPFFDVENGRQGEYSESQARRIEQLLDFAKEKGIRVKATFEHFRTIPVDPKNMYGAIFGRPNYGIENGGHVTDMTDFLKNETNRNDYRKKLDWYKHRFGSDPVIFAYELWNEMNAVSGEGWEEWTRIFLGEVKNRFPRTLVTQSLGSLDREAAVKKNRENCMLPGNNISQVHRYLDLGASWEICHGPLDVSLAQAMTEMRSWNLSKPIMIAESGAVEPKHTGPFKYYPKDKEGILLHDILFTPFFCGAAGTGNIWHWESYVDANNLWWQFGRFSAVVKGLDPPAENFSIISTSQEPLRIYALYGKKTLLIWCRDAGNTWKTELVDDQPPAEISNFSLDLTPVGKLSGKAKVLIYDPWKDKWSGAKIRKNCIRLPSFKRSIVIRVNLSDS